MLGAGTWMGQEKKRFQMTLEFEMVPGGDGSYLVRACSACVSCFGSLPSKTQLRGSREVLEGTEEHPVKSHQKRGELQGWGEAKRHQGQGVGLQECETTLL